MKNRVIVEDFLEQLRENDPSMVAPIQALLDIPVPMFPRITKSTAVAAIEARFSGSGELLERFEVAKEQANLWDGERDGLREAVKKINPGQFKSSVSGSTVILSRTETAKVLYPNASGKHQIENCLQTDILSPFVTPGTGVIVIKTEAQNCEAFLDSILHELQKSKGAAISFLVETLVGIGHVVDNSELFEKKGSEKSAIAVIPPTA